MHTSSHSERRIDIARKLVAKEAAAAKAARDESKLRLKLAAAQVAAIGGCKEAAKTAEFLQRALRFV